MIKLVFSHIKILAVLSIGLAVLCYLIFFPNSSKTPSAEKDQRITELQVVQFYLHLTGKDYIIGRSSQKFNKLLAIVNKTVSSMSKPQLELGNWVEELEDNNENKQSDVLKTIQDIKDKTVSLSIWLMEPQKISTQNQGAIGWPKDEHGNAVITTDRMLVVLSGKYIGTIFIRDVNSGKWSPWELQKSSIMPLVELIRGGSL